MRLVEKRAKDLNAHQVGALCGLVLSARAANEQSVYKECSDIRRRVRGKHYQGLGGGEKDAALVETNLSYAHIRSTAPALFLNTPAWTAEADNPMHDESAVTWQNMLAAYTKRTGYREQTEEIVLDSVVYPDAWKKWFFTRKHQDDEFGSSFKASASEMSLAEQSDAVNYTWEDKQAIVGVRLSPEKVVTDDPRRKIEHSRFIAIEYTKPLEELIHDPRYENVKKELTERRGTVLASKPNRVTELGTDGAEDQESASTKSDHNFTFYEVWVKQLVLPDDDPKQAIQLYKQVIYISPDLEKPMRKIGEESGWEAYIGPFAATYGYPFNRLELNPLPDSRGLSETLPWRDLERNIEWIMQRKTAFVDNDRQVFNVYEDELANPKEFDQQMKSGASRIYVKAKTSGKPAIEPVPGSSAGHRDDSLLATSDILRQQISGGSKNRSGGAGIRTAREATIVEASAQVKESYKTQRVADFLDRDAAILSRMMRHGIDGDQVFKLIGPSAGVKWGKFTSDDAAWQPDFTVDPTSFRGDIDQEKIQKLGTAIQLGAQIAPLFPNIRFDILYSRLLKASNISGVHDIVPVTVPDEIKQLNEIVVMMGTGEPIEVQPNENHEVEYRTIMNILNQPMFDQLDPQIQQALIQHAQQHEQLIKEMQSQLSSVNDGSIEGISAGIQGGGAPNETSDGFVLG